MYVDVSNLCSFYFISFYFGSVSLLVCFCIFFFVFQKVTDLFVDVKIKFAEF